MFEKTCDVFIQQLNDKTKPIPISDMPNFFKTIRKAKLPEIIKDINSFTYYKEKMIDMEKKLVELDANSDFNKLIFPLLGFAKIYTNFCSIDNSLIQSKLNTFPNTIFTYIFKYLHENFKESAEKKENELIPDLFYEELDELIFEINESVEENNLIVGTSSTSKLFHHLLNILFIEDLSNFTHHQKNIYKYIANICIFLYSKTPEENDKKLMLEEIFLRIQTPMKLNLLVIELDNLQKINVLSYFFLKLPQSSLYLFLLNNANVSYTKENKISQHTHEFIYENTIHSLKLIKNIVGYLFKKCKEDIKSKTNINKFVKIFLNDIMETLENQEFPSVFFYHQAFSSVIIDSLQKSKGEADNNYKLLLIDFIKYFLLNFMKNDQFFQNKKEKLLGWLAQKPDLSNPSTSTKPKNRAKQSKENPAKNQCEICYCDFDEEIKISNQRIDEKSNKSQYSEICLLCYMKELCLMLNFPRKPEFSLDKLFKSPTNPLFFYIMLHSFNQKSLEAKKFNASRQFFLVDWLYHINPNINKFIKKSYLPIISDMITENWNPNTSIPFINDSTFAPNEFLIKYLRVSLFFSEETERLFDAFKSLLYLLSNENISIRNKVLETVQSIISNNPDMIYQGKFQDIISQRVLDSAISVRSTAIGIIMRFYENNWVDEDFYFDILLERLNDIDSSLRKKILGFFNENIMNLKNNESILRKVLKAVVYKIYDNEEISLIALNLVCRLIFETFNEGEKKKKGKKNSNTEFNSQNIKKNLKNCKELCIELKNNEWLNKVIKYSAISSENAIKEQELKGMLTSLINDLTEKHTEQALGPENIVNLEMLLGFSKYYSIFLSQELNFLNDYLKYLSELNNMLKLKGNQSINELFALRKYAILLLLDILDSLLSVQNENELKNMSFIKNFTEIEQYLIKFIQEEALEILHKSLKLLISSVKKATENFFIIKNIYIQTYAFVLKKKITLDLENAQKFEELTIDNLQNFMRCLYILTFLTRYFDISEFFDEEEQQKPEYQEKNLIKIIFNELILFCKYKNPIIEQTCIECIMILWEKLPILIFETRGFVEKYLLDVSTENKDIVEKIFSCFLNLLLRHDEKIKRQNSLKRHINNKFMEKQKEKKNKNKKKGKKNESEDEDEQTEEENLEKAVVIEDKDYEKLAGMIKEMTKTSFSLHIFNQDVVIRKKILQLLQTLIIQGHISSYEADEYFICFLNDSNEEIRIFCEDIIRFECKNNRMNLLSSLHQGVRKGYEYLIKRQGKALPFIYDSENDEIISFYKKFNSILAKGNDEIDNHFVVLLIENYALYSNGVDLQFLQFICSILLTLNDYSIWEIHEVLNRLFGIITKNYYKNIKRIQLLTGKKNLLKSSSTKSKESEQKIPEKIQENNNENKEIVLKEDLYQCFSLFTQLLTFHLIIMSSVHLKELCSFQSCTPQDYLDKLERYIKKNPYIKQKEVDSESVTNKTENSSKKQNCNVICKYETLQEFNNFIEKNMDFELYAHNKENIYLLYKKIKFLFSYNISESLDVLFTFNQDMLEKYREQTLWSKKKSKSKGKKTKTSEEIVIKKIVSKAKNNKKVIVDEDDTKIFIAGRRKKEKKETNAAPEEIKDNIEVNYQYKGRLRKKKSINLKEVDESE